MSLALSFILIFGFIVVYIIFIEFFSLLFRMTGLTREKARFQTISLFTNAGFTTSESEVVTRDRKRRRIAISCMITGNVFSVIIVALIINIFTQISNDKSAVKNSINVLIWAISGSALFIIIFNIPFVKRQYEKIIDRIATYFMKNKKKNVITLLDSYGKDAIAEVYINIMPQILDGKSLLESKLKDMYQMNILMLKRKGRVIDVTKDTIFQVHDILVIFGSHQNIKDCFEHPGKEADDILEIENKITENFIDLIDNYGKEAMAEVTINKIPDFLIDTKIKDSGLKDKYNINLLMLKRNDEVKPVSADTIIEVGDILTVFGLYISIKTAFLNRNNKV